MFTIHQIEEVNAKVKGATGFTNYIEALINLGVISYSIYANDGHADYYGVEEHCITLHAKHYPVLEMFKNSDPERLLHALAIHQQGQTNYLTFCKHAASAGVYKWTVDLEIMQCTYFDINQEIIISERIPFTFAGKDKF